VFNIEVILSFLVVIGILAGLIDFVYVGDLYLFILIASGLVLLIYYLIIKFNKYIFVLIGSMLLLFIFLLKFLFYQSTGDITFYLLLNAQIGIGMHFIESKNSYRIFVAIYLTLVAITLAYFLGGVAPGDISQRSSENIVNYVVLAFSVMLIALHYKKYNNIIFSPAIFSTLVSFWTLGRSGMLVSLFLLIGMYIVKYYERISKLTLSISLIVLTLFGYTIYNFTIEIITKVIYRFGERTTFIEDSPRLKIINDYLNKLNFKTFFLGFDFSENYFYGYTNLHNSFLNLQSKFGIGGIILIILLIGILLYFLINKQFLYFVLMLSLLVRGATDIVILVGRYDFVLMYLILIFMESRRLQMAGKSTNHYNKNLT